MNVACWGFEPGSENNLTGLAVRCAGCAECGGLPGDEVAGHRRAALGWHMLGVVLPANN